MDNRLILSILFVTLSCGCMSTFAQTTNTTASGSDTTTSPTVTTTTASGTTTSAGVSATNPTTVTTASSSGTTTSAGVSATNPTTVTSASSSGTTTSAGVSATNPTSITTSTTTTTAPPLVSNSTVVTLDTPINRTGCGSQQLCAAQPTECDPSSSGSSCFFLAAKQQSGQNFDFELSGESNGYIAATLSPDATLGGNDTTYVCANSNGVVKFFGALLDNGKLTKKTVSANSVKGKINGAKIQCTFSATVPSSSQRAADVQQSVSISTGDFNPTSEELGSPTPVLRSGVINLASPNTTVTNELTTNTTSAPTTNSTNSTNTAYPVTHQQTLTMPALLVTVIMLAFTMQ